MWGNSEKKEKTATIIRKAKSTGKGRAYQTGVLVGNHVHKFHMIDKLFSVKVPRSDRIYLFTRLSPLTFMLIKPGEMLYAKKGFLV